MEMENSCDVTAKCVNVKGVQTLELFQFKGTYFMKYLLIGWMIQSVGVTVVIVNVNVIAHLV